VCRPAVHAGDTVLVELEAELCRDDDAVTRDVELLECPSEQLLVRVRAVRLGGVEQRYAELDGALYRGDGFALVALLRCSVGLGHTHQAEAERGDREALGTECACLQHRR
jgi:hypothetical protein